MNDPSAAQAHSPVSTKEVLWDAVVMALLWVAVYLVLHPLQNTPFLDDWIYAWRVRWLLDHGQLRTLEYSSNPNFVQVVWGALFCWPFGFSFTALRVSTGVLAVAATWGQYLLLRELGVARRDSWIGTALLCFNPIFFLLAFTFMTEVPFLCAAIWAVYLTVRAVRTESTRLLWAGIAVACLSMGIRVVGITVPVATALVLLFHPSGWGRRKLRFAYSLMAPVMLGGFLMIALGGKAERTIEPEQWQGLWWMLPGILPYVGTCVGLWLLPLAAGCFSRSRMAVAAVFFVPLAGLITWFMIYRNNTGTFPVGNDTWPLMSNSWPLFRDSFWALGELGDTQREVPGYLSPGLAVGWAWVVGMLGAASLAGVLAGAWEHRKGSAERLFLWAMAGLFFLIALLGLNFDRYVLPMLPLGIALALSGRAIRRRVLAAGLTGVFAVASLVGVRDHLSYNAALWQGVEELRRNGVADPQINGGYVVNGWLQRTHPETAPKDAKGEFLAPWWNPEQEAQYQYDVANSPRPGTRVLKTVPYTQWFGSPGRIYILARE